MNNKAEMTVPDVSEKQTHPVFKMLHVWLNGVYISQPFSCSVEDPPITQEESRRTEPTLQETYDDITVDELINRLPLVGSQSCANPTAAAAHTAGSTSQEAGGGAEEGTQYCDWLEIHLCQ